MDEMDIRDARDDDMVDGIEEVEAAMKQDMLRTHEVSTKLQSVTQYPLHG